MEIERNEIINDKEEELEIEENNLEFSSDEDEDNIMSNNKKEQNYKPLNIKLKL